MMSRERRAVNSSISAKISDLEKLIERSAILTQSPDADRQATIGTHMLVHLLPLMGFQLVGELIVTGLNLTFPGPLCGLLLLLAWLHVSGGPSENFARAATVLVDNLGLLFVPAGTAIIGFGALLLSEGLAIITALLLSTGLAIFVSGLVGGVRPTSSPKPLQE